MPATSETVRKEIVEALGLDLVGPSNDHAFAEEILPESPARWYLTGFLVPTDADLADRTDETADDEIDAAAEGDAADDASQPDRGAAKKGPLPSSLGLSVLLPPEAKELTFTLEWGDYRWAGEQPEPGDLTSPVEEGPPEGAEPGANAAGGGKKAYGQARMYRRVPRSERKTIPLPEPGAKPLRVPVPNSKGLFWMVTTRRLTGVPRLADGTLAVSVFVVNQRPPEDSAVAYRAFAFQVTLRLESAQPFCARPDPRAELAEWDERVADLQYRDAMEYVVGHGVAGAHQRAPDGQVHQVLSEWMPQAQVERVAASDLPGVELGMEALAGLDNAETAKARLAPLVRQYRDWIALQRGKLTGLEPRQASTGADLCTAMATVADRIEAGITLLADPDVFYAFCLANKVMAAAARRREAIQKDGKPAEMPQPKWRPFQLAFLLMTLRGISEPGHERGVVDLLFFPTGGGKTEAYLGLAAFTMVLRRRRFAGIRSAGMSVLMRYTLRLLTLDQLGRAAALMCALELEREKDERLGKWPFEIGLWVGSAATPNRLGKKGYRGPGEDSTAYIKNQRYQRDSKNNPAPIPLEDCPWCGTKFDPSAFRLVPSDVNPKNLQVSCVNHACDFTRDRPLPILAVDEAIYRRLPAFLIATVDKFAALPWTGEVGALFGRVDRYDKDGFYGPAAPGLGSPLHGLLPGPDLIIQDELHLISGPLGTIAGVYEAAIDWLASREVEGVRFLPKIIASTATVRRADAQIRALFNRSPVTVFPPPGPDRRDSFFAHTVPAAEQPARLYVGVAAQGRSLKVVFLRTALALLSAGQALYEREGGKRNRGNPVDPYMTLLGYFNSLRELGGTRRIVEDEVTSKLEQRAARRRLAPPEKLFANREIAYVPVELTSRESTANVALAKLRLRRAFHENDRVDVALATNMISVGLDIVRLGLMVVLGQPKTSAEYIQATSRVGRQESKPGLVVTLLNIHKPRDRSHYERFAGYHATFYRAVEATSVTPFSPRALDRALAGALVGLVRQGMPTMTPSLGAAEIERTRAELDQFALWYAERARDHLPSPDPDERERLRQNVLHRCKALFDDWFGVARDIRLATGTLKYQEFEPGDGKRLLYGVLDPELEALSPQQRQFRANRSMRDVETSVELAVKPLKDWGERK